MVVCYSGEPRGADTVRKAERGWGNAGKEPRVIAGLFLAARNLARLAVPGLGHDGTGGLGLPLGKPCDSTIMTK